jgi:hypothetical protein
MIHFLSIADIALIFFCQTESSLLGKHWRLEYLGFVGQAFQPAGIPELMIAVEKAGWKACPTGIVGVPCIQGRSTLGL